MRAWLSLLRPWHWIKNGFVLAPLLFSGAGEERVRVAHALVALVAFCLTASGVYALNDVADRADDRLHPAKRSRPVAAGRITVRAASIVGVGSIALGIGTAFLASAGVSLVIAGYVTLAVLYSAWLKHVVLLDVFSIAAFFVMRLLAGSLAIGVTSSFWLLLCGGLLALYLGFAKRRHELALLGSSSSEHRRVMSHYSIPYLDQMSAVLLATTLVAYIMFTQLSSTAASVGSQWLGWSSVFVVYGLLRYLYLVHQRTMGSPTETVLADPALLIDVALWLIYCAWLVYR